MAVARYVIALSMCAALSALGATPATEEGEVLRADAMFWTAYNHCDMTSVGNLLTADVEFYHDKTGLTTSRKGVVDSLRSGPCASQALRLRREAVQGSLAFHPLAGGYALLSGRHRFYVTEAGTPERLDGQAEFTTVWKSEAGQWRMHRVMSYAHGPAPYSPPPRTMMLPADVLMRYAGAYRSSRIGEILVEMDGDHLKLTAGDFVATLYPESASRFFAIEKDVRFDFETDGKGDVASVAVYENGVVTERARRTR
jgi:hypothetical protein